MPELLEVNSIVQDLDVAIRGATISKIEFSSWFTERTIKKKPDQFGLTDNVTGLKPATEAWDGRKTMVGERSAGGEGALESVLERAGVRMPA